MAAGPIKTLELHYPMIIFLFFKNKFKINVSVVMINMSTLEWFFCAEKEEEMFHVNVTGKITIKKKKNIL